LTLQVLDIDGIAASICHSNSLTLIKSLGRGSFKHVFLVKDSHGNHYALKIIHDPKPSPRAQREIDSLRRCDHPSIGRLISVDVHAYQGSSFQYLLEEFLPGGTLSSLIAEKGSLKRVEALNIALRLVDALDHLNSLRLVHRDIKPDNIMFREDGITPVLVDFGCVRDLSASSLTQTWAHHGPGTPYFASPEQLNNQKPLIDWRSDQFSLAVTLFFAIFDGHPYQYPDEPLFATTTVERVAKRGLRRPDFEDMILGTDLPPLGPMTEPWPVSRFRLPAELTSALKS
jgi:serine/threonine protein kinase